MSRTIGPPIARSLDMFKKLILSFTTVALAVASAATYNVTLYQDSKLNGKTLKPGEYRLEVKDNAVILKSNKDTTEAAARTETNAKKFSGTSVLYNDKDEVTCGIHVRGFV